MFERPVKVKRSAHCKSSVQKKLTKDIKKFLPFLTDEEIAGWFPQGEQLHSVRLDPRVDLYCVQSSESGSGYIPLVFDVTGHKDFLPSLYALHRGPVNFPVIPILARTVAFLMKESVPPLMIPGVLLNDEGGFNMEFEAGDYVIVSVIGGSGPIAVGRAEMSSSQLARAVQNGQKGRAIELIHILNDNLWKLGPQNMPVDLIPTEGGVKEEVEDENTDELSANAIKLAVAMSSIPAFAYPEPYDSFYLNRMENNLNMTEVQCKEAFDELVSHRIASTMSGKKGEVVVLGFHPTEEISEILESTGGKREMGSSAKFESIEKVYQLQDIVLRVISRPSIAAVATSPEEFTQMQNRRVAIMRKQYVDEQFLCAALEKYVIYEERERAEEDFDESTVEMDKVNVYVESALSFINGIENHIGTQMQFEDVIKCMLRKAKTRLRLTRQDGKITVANAEPIRITASIRASRKFTTAIFGLDRWGLDMEEFTRNLRQKHATRATITTGADYGMGKADCLVVTMSGLLVNELAEYLVERVGIPEDMVTTEIPKRVSNQANKKRKRR
ncbi:hypothetical protein PCE1_001556 [Barthelona sp. PCE]